MVLFNLVAKRLCCCCTGEHDREKDWQPVGLKGNRLCLVVRHLQLKNAQPC
ncbi:hypothetical protein SAMN05720354_10315 [Nitrosospira sp. Nsp1]|nr:hypothetical protein SAMN05720354_10315 [Nitrosospira sp. Nsp1]